MPWMGSSFQNFSLIYKHTVPLPNYLCYLMQYQSWLYPDGLKRERTFKGSRQIFRRVVSPCWTVGKVSSSLVQIEAPTYCCFSIVTSRQRPFGAHLTNQEASSLQMVSYSFQSFNDSWTRNCMGINDIWPGCYFENATCKGEQTHYQLSIVFQLR